MQRNEAFDQRETDADGEGYGEAGDVDGGDEKEVGEVEDGAAGGCHHHRSGRKMNLSASRPLACVLALSLLQMNTVGAAADDPEVRAFVKRDPDDPDRLRAMAVPQDIRLLCS